MGEFARVEFRPEPTGPNPPAPESTPTNPLAIPDNTSSVAEPSDKPTLEEKPGGLSPAPGLKPEPEPEPKEEPTEPEPGGSKSAEAPKGLDSSFIDKLNQEYAEKGELSEDSFKEIESRGIPRDLASLIVARLAEGNKAIQQLQAMELYNSVGGQDNYQNMQKWAATNLSKEEKAEFNKTLESGDLAKIKLAVAGVYAKFTSALGSDPSRVSGARGTTGPVPFRSPYEMKEAMKDPRYAKDEAYRREVMERIKVSNF